MFLNCISSTQLGILVHNTFVSPVLGQGLFFSITSGTKVYFIAKKTTIFNNGIKI